MFPVTVSYGLSMFSYGFLWSLDGFLKLYKKAWLEDSFGSSRRVAKG